MHTTTTTSGTTPSTGISAPYQYVYGNTPDCLAIQQQPPLTQDFHRDTFFNPTWMSGPNAFSFAQDSTIIHPETYMLEPYPGYHAGRAQRQESADSLYLERFPKGDPKPWKNIAISEQDDAEYEAFKERMRIGALGEGRQHPALYAHAQGPITGQPRNASGWPPAGGSGR